MACNSRCGNGSSLGARRGGGKAQDEGDRLMLYQSIDRYSGHHGWIAARRARVLPRQAVPA